VVIAKFKKIGTFHHILLTLLSAKFNENPSRGYRVFIVKQMGAQIEMPTEVNTLFGCLPFATKNLA
jgi:hypothetical protein